MLNLQFAKAVLVLSTLLLAGCATAAASEIDTSGMHPIDELQPLAELAANPAVEAVTADLIPAPVEQPGGVQVSLAGPYSSTSWDQRDPAQTRFQIPALFLRRQNQAADEAERTLELQVSGIAGGTEIQVQAISHHIKLASGTPHKMVQAFVTPAQGYAHDQPCAFHWALDAAKTPSDYYTLRVKDADGALLWEQPGPERPALVALDTWDVPLGTYTVRVYYGTLFPFARAEYAPDTRLPASQVTAFIANQFAPIIADTWRTQAELWGFGQPFHPDWDADHIVEIIITAPPFALFDGTGTGTVLNDAQGQPYPERRIWWVSNNNSFAEYNSLENGFKAVLSHEFFHLMQWNVLLDASQAPPADQPIRYWQFSFIEGQGLFAPTVQYPELTLQADHLLMDSSRYVKEAANGYLARRLNGSYQGLETDREHRYDMALYWRFLYEQYGHMDVIRAALEEMARYLANQDGADTEIVGSIEPVMDAALAHIGGPFRTYEESLIAFARANYALRLENGRCTAADLAVCAACISIPRLCWTGHHWKPNWYTLARRQPIAARCRPAMGWILWRCDWTRRCRASR